LRANGAELATVAIRPHLIWGPGDNHLIPRLVARARAGRLRQIGKQPKLVDTVYIDNAADAHLLAADRLTPTTACAGKAYFVAQGEPLPLWDLINRILDAAGLPPVSRRIPATVAYAAGGLCEALWTVLGRQTEPPMTRFLARELSTSHWFNLEAARRDLGYRPCVSVDEGLRRLRKSFQQGAR
jgi:nucleoside-diphosphate-sugar epimerase